MEIHPGKKIQSLMAVYVAGISALTAYNHCNAAAPVLIGVFGQLYVTPPFPTPRVGSLHHPPPTAVPSCVPHASP